MLDVGIKETTNTAGTGAITLSAVPGFVRVSDAFGLADMVGYHLVSGNGDQEWGIGTAGSGNTLSRDYIQAVRVGGVFNNATPAAIDLTGTSTLICTPHTATSQGFAAAIKVPGVGDQYFCPYALTTANPGAAAYSANILHAMPFALSMPPGVVSALGMAVTTAGVGTAYIGIYESAISASGIQPGRLLAQTAAIDVSTTGEKLSTGLSVRLKVGSLYWLAMCSSVNISVRANGNTSALGMTPGGVDGFRSHIRATNAGALPNDASGATFSLASKSVIPPMLYMKC